MKLVMILLFAVLAASVPMEKRNINEVNLYLSLPFAMQRRKH